MLKLMRTAALASLTLVGLAPAAALADTPIAIYQTTDRNVDFQLAYCGPDNKNLCVTLLAARKSGDVAMARQNLGKKIIDQAAPVGKNQWYGTASYMGYTGAGTMTLRPGKDFTIHACVLMVICSDQMLIPAR
jgi:hypothetical protein